MKRKHPRWKPANPNILALFGERLLAQWKIRLRTHGPHVRFLHHTLQRPPLTYDLNSSRLKEPGLPPQHAYPHDAVMLAIGVLLTPNQLPCR